nr:unnamed protein product [Callosobruchus analis]
MNILHPLVLLCCVIAAYSADSPIGHDDTVPVPKQNPIPAHVVETSPATTEDVIHTKPTTKPTTTATTVSPKTTVTPITTSSTVTTPKTSSAPPTTPTTSPKTTVTPPPTTSVAPTPAPKPEVGNWTVDYNNSNRSCIVMQAEIQLQLVWMQNNKTMNKTWVVPTSAKSSGACGNDSQWISLNWDESSQLVMGFVKTKERKFEVQNVTALLNMTLPDQGPKVWTFSAVNQTDFPTPLQMSYKCMREQTLKLQANESVANSTFINLKLSHVQMQAFRNSDSHKFDSALDCDGSVVNDTVPIVVGSVLIVMILMILVAYLLGRRRCQARGYLSI